MRRADIIMQNSKRLRMKHEEELRALKQPAASQTSAKENSPEQFSIRPPEKKKARTDERREIRPTDRSEQKQKQLMKTSNQSVSTVTRHPLQAVERNVDVDEHEDVNSMSENEIMDISLPLSPNTMDIINSSLSGSSAFAALIQCENPDECISTMSVVPDKTPAKFQTVLEQPPTSSNITTESSEPINTITVGAPATVFASDGLPVPDRTPAKFQTVPHVLEQPSTSSHITRESSEPINTITVGGSAAPATVFASDGLPVPDRTPAKFQTVPHVLEQPSTSSNITTESSEPITTITVGDSAAPATARASAELQRNDFDVPSPGTFECGATSQTKKQKAKNGFADKSKWKKVQRQQRRMTGEAYCSTAKNVNGENTVQEPRVIGERCTSKRCLKSKHCNDFSDEDRQQLFDAFWKDMDWGQRKVYVAGLADIHDVKRQTVQNSRRQCSITYHLKKDQTRLKVCREMFLSTLCLGEWSVRDWATNNTEGIHKSAKRQVPTTTRHTEATEMRESVRKFLHDLPKLPSHYCRASTSKEYLEPHFHSIAEVYRAFEEHQPGQSPSRQVFTEEFHKMNIGLYMPKKDQCDKCCAYAVGNLPDEVYNEHIARKEEARTSKAQDKERAKEGQCHVLTMDVQAVQLIPYLQASALYFKQKLAVHNFTLYNLANDDVVCYVWHEGEGELNANIFASCVMSYLENEIECDKEVIIYSDGCGNQNRNSTLANALSTLARKKGVSITQKYLEKGHMQMECDSVHSVIERRKKRRDLHSPAQYVQLIQEARLKPPYKVHYVQHGFFTDYSGLRMYSSIRPGRKVGDPTVTDLRCMKYLPSGKIQFKLRHIDEWQFLQQPRRAVMYGYDDANARPLYSSSIPIKHDKYKDLQSLKNVIIPDFHSFYDNLRHQ